MSFILLIDLVACVYNISLLSGWRLATSVAMVLLAAVCHFVIFMLLSHVRWQRKAGSNLLYLSVLMVGCNLVDDISLCLQHFSALFIVLSRFLPASIYHLNNSVTTSSWKYLATW